MSNPFTESGTEIKPTNTTCNDYKHINFDGRNADSTSKMFLASMLERIKIDFEQSQLRLQPYKTYNSRIPMSGTPLNRS
jgi:hypothetical protein